ncbi:MAG: ankyrin repeat domain-containing protein [Pirellulaceae bacterium]
MRLEPANTPLAEQASQAIRAGDTTSLQRMLEKYPDLATARIHDTEQDCQRSLLHIATDWPGHFPQVEKTIRVLVSAGADVNARFVGPHNETPLHWAASSNDVAAVDALLDAGADIEADGSVINGGAPLSNAIAFWQWDAARHLAEGGAVTSLGDEAAMGMMDRMAVRFAAGDPPHAGHVNYAFWIASAAGQQSSAEFLLGRGADVNWIPEWDKASPLDVATKGEHESLVLWLRDQGAQSADR